MKRLPVQRLIVFAAFAALAAGGWGSLLADPPILRLCLAVAFVLAAAVALCLLPLERMTRPRAATAIALVAGAGLIAAVVALGVPPKGLQPWGWDELADEVDRGIEGLSGSIEYPLASGEAASRWLLIVAMPVFLIAAAVVAFGRRDRSAPAPVALVLLVAAFAVPATIRPAAAPLAWGFVLLALISLWLWQRPGRWVYAAVTVACFGAVAVPIASGMDTSDPVLDYRDWTLPEPEPGATFEWDQSYGPITWERTSDVLLEVRTADPAYLRAEVLDDFYGYGWQRSESGGQAVPEDIDPIDGTLDVRGNDRWVGQSRISVKGLESPLVLSPGTELDLSGVEGVDRADDATLRIEGDPLTEGSDYSITAYAPDPSPDLMRKRSTSYGPELRRYTEIALPYSAPDPETGLVSVRRVQVPLWGSGLELTATAAGEIEGSPYPRVAELAERLTAGQPTAYDAARVVESYVRDNATYTESPREHPIPLNDFLFGDRLGYCQHFSGAMALILRFAGIPTRVVSGFTPGEPLGAPGPGANDYVVTGLDAHSWVEVYFEGIGWVPFEPTPAEAPNRSQVEVEEEDDAGGGGLGDEDDRAASRNREPIIDAGEGGNGAGSGSDGDEAASSGDGGSPLLLVLAVLAGLTGLAALITLARTLRHRRMGPQEAADRELRELAAALGAAGLRQPELTTLRRVQLHFERLNLPAAAAYARRLAELRFARSPGTPPTLAERRAARRDLGSGGGPMRRLRMLVAMPPGGPRS